MIGSNRWLALLGACAVACAVYDNQTPSMLGGTAGETASIAGAGADNPGKGLGGTSSGSGGGAQTSAGSGGYAGSAGTTSNGGTPGVTEGGDDSGGDAGI